MDRHQANHKSKQAADANSKEQVILDSPRKVSPAYQHGKAEYWEWEKTTFNTPNIDVGE